MPESTTLHERLLLAAVLISGNLPTIEPHLDDFTPAALQIWNAATGLAERGEVISCLNVWRADRRIDPVLLCEVVSEFPIDLPSRHVNLLLMALEGQVRRQREAA